MNKRLDKLGRSFDTLKTRGEQRAALVMLLTGFCVEKIEPNNRSNELNNLVKDTLERLKQFEGSKYLAFVKVEGTA